MVVLHYTGMEDAASAIARLRDPEARVSCHYLIAEDGQILRMVAEEKRAWHAGQSYWRGIHGVNGASIGIEIVNPGHEFGYRPFPEQQMDALIPLLAGIVERHQIPRANVVGHSDIAPARKQDPGELFDWARLARHGLAMPGRSADLVDPHWTDGGFLLALERYGYDVRDAPGRDRRLPAPLPPRAARRHDRRRMPRDPSPAALGPRARPRYIGPARGSGGRGSASSGGEESPGSMERRCRLTAGGGDPRESATESRSTAASARQGRKGAVRAHRASGNGGGTANPTGSKTE